METKRNQKYFISKGVNVTLFVGLAIALFGIILLFSPTTRQFGIVILLVGLGVAVFGSGAKSGENDIDNQIEGQIKDIPEQAMIKYNVYDGNMLTIINPVFVKGFDFTSEGILSKKGPDHKCRTSVYNAAQLYFTKDRIYVYGKHISLVDGTEEANYLFGDEYIYENVDCAYITDSTVKVDGRDFPVHTFGLRLKDGKDAFSFTVEYGADVDKARDDINHVIQKMAERAAEKAAEKAAKRAALRAKDAAKAAE